MTRPSIDMAAFGKRMRAVRHAYGASIGQPNINRATFARALGFETETYRRWERGHIQPPLVALAAIRLLTGISLDYLITDHEQGARLPWELGAECTATFATRVRWAREISSLGSTEAAKAMGVSAETYARWEDGRELMPESKQAEFAHRFNVSLPYLAQGRTEGVDIGVLRILHALHPGLWVTVPAPVGSDTPSSPGSDTAEQPRRAADGDDLGEACPLQCAQCDQADR
jgi:transcriptional regulator with XRE-family HTH domain